MLLSNKPSDNDTDSLFLHTACPHWGVGLLVWERESKRAFQFEDGKLRVFKEGYYELLKPVDRPLDESASLLAELVKQHKGRPVTKSKAPSYVGIPLPKQIEYFLSRYPKGFQGAKWAKQHRGLDAKRILKRHRNADIANAKRVLAAPRLATMLQSGQALSVIGELVELLDGTDMITKAQARGLERMNEADAVRVVSALSDLLWGEGDRRFGVWLSALRRAIGKEPSWALATVLPAMVRPNENVCVKLSTFARQAAWMAPNLTLERQPSERSYGRLLEMMDSVREKLFAAGLRPRDMTDLYDFIAITLKPKAVNEMAAHRSDAEAIVAAETAAA